MAECQENSESAYLASIIFMTEKYVLRLWFESFFTRMISNLKYKWLPGVILRSKIDLGRKYLKC